MSASDVEEYATWARPALARRLSAIGLSVQYHAARGDRLRGVDHRGEAIEVLDLVGGLGASLLGHNHPELEACARETLDAQRPFHAQGSIRGPAARLAHRLAERVGRATGREYVVTLANTGAEAIEAALKHAEMERGARARRVLDRLGRLRHEIAIGRREQRVHLPDELFDRLARRLGLEAIHDLDDVLSRVERSVLDAVERPPIILAIEGAFHGKTSGALQLTHNPRFRAPWRHLGPKVEFLPPNDPAAARAALRRARIPHLDLALAGDGRVELVDAAFVAVAGIFVEPIQGEGGVRPLQAEYLEALRAIADEGEVPLVFDEIQCGMGRTGTFLASEHAGVRADYYTLAKTLSGGFAKIAALLVDRERYLDDFGYVHTSTYAEDDFSSAVADRVLDILGRDDDRVLRMCRDKGDHLLRRLRELRARYPDQLRDVRGRGLMVGVELASQEGSRSPLIRVASEQGRLGQLACGYLLAEERIRALPTLSAPRTLRIQPSAFIEVADLDRWCDALERLLIVLRESDGYRLTRYLADAARVDAPAPGVESLPAAPPQPEPEGRVRVGFLAHFGEPEDLRRWDPTLAPLSRDECARFLDRIEGALDPFVLGHGALRSATGRAVTVTAIVVPFTPEQAIAAMRRGDGGATAALVRRGAELARRLGCGVLGLGGYTSIVTHNCRDLALADVAVTSGNSLTAAVALEAALRAADRLEVSERRVGVVGAAGNIGAVIAEVAFPEVQELVLVGRPAAESRLARVAARLSGSDSGPRVTIATDLGALRECNVVVSATNSPRPILRPEHVSAHGPVVISDVAVPGDVDPSVGSARPNAVVLAGGSIAPPRGQRLEIPGLSTDSGALYACLAESVILGMHGIHESFSYGPLEAAQVRRARDLARMHGFEIEERRA